MLIFTNFSRVNETTCFANQVSIQYLKIECSAAFQ